MTGKCAECVEAGEAWADQWGASESPRCGFCGGVLTRPVAPACAGGGTVPAGVVCGVRRPGEAWRYHMTRVPVAVVPVPGAVDYRGRQVYLAGGWELAVWPARVL